MYCFGPLYGRFLPMQVYGPSGRTKQEGTAWFCEKLMEMTHWAADSFKIMPAGEGFGIEVHEFDWKDAGGVAYERNGVRIIHWPASHTKDGASAYQLDWNGLSFVYLGDGRPSQLAIKYGKDADILAMETFPELLSMTSGAMGIPEPVLRYAMDTFHSQNYAAGYIFREANVRMGVLTHGAFDIGWLPEVLAQTRVHYKGLIGLGMPDFATFNVTKDAIWRREGAVADFGGTRTEPPAPGAKPPGFPPNAREHIQEQSIRDNEIDPKRYYPEGTVPQLVTKFPGKK